MGHDEARGKTASDSPKPAEEGTNPVSELTDLHPAFDSIDDTMKDVARREVTVTPETLEQIVNDAVAKAISAYDKARAATPDVPAAPQGGAAPHQARDIAPRQPAGPAAVALSPWRAKLERLQGDLGLDEIEFESASPAPAEPVEDRALSAQMGVHDFEFDDVPGEAAAEPAVAAPLDIEAVAEWMNTPAATPDVYQVRATARGKPAAGNASQELDWVAAELAELDAAEGKIAAPPAPPPAPEPPPYQAPEVVAPAIEQPRAAAIEEPRAEVTREVRDTGSGLASWFRSALGDRSPQREPATVPVPELTAPLMPAASVAPQPAPEVEAPAPVAAKPEEQPGPTREPAAALKPPSPEAAETVRFTFDPIPPVPPRLPREPNEPRQG